MREFILTFVLSLSIVAFPVLARAGESIIGTAWIVDGDSFVINGQRIRLHGIDAFEFKQMCKTHQGKRWRCGEAAARALHKLTAARDIICHKIATDKFKRIIAQCTVSRDGQHIDIAQAQLANGWAVAYTAAWRKSQRINPSKRGGLGGKFIMPRAWRRGARLP